MEDLVIIPIQDVNPLTEEDEIRFTIQGCKHTFYKSESGKTLINESELDLYDQILFSNPFILEIFCALAYSIDKFSGPCPEYQIFNQITRSSVIANLNHDDLANNFINTAIPLIPLHGTVQNCSIKFLQDNIGYIIENGYNPSFIKDLYLSTQENIELLLKNQNYRVFIETLCFKNFLNIVIIGYSFFKKNGSEIYDRETYQFIREYLLRNKKCNLVIIDLNPGFVADIFSKDTFHNAVCFTLNWSAFTQSMFYVSKHNLSNIFKLKYSEYASAYKLYNHWMNTYKDNVDEDMSLFSKAKEIFIIPYSLSSDKNLVF